MEWGIYLIIGIIFGLFFIISSWAFKNYNKNSVSNDTDDGSLEIFNDEEPLGRQTDFFRVIK